MMDMRPDSPERKYDLERIIRGKALFIDDITLPDMMYMSVLRSPYARARIVSISGGITSKDLLAYVASMGEGTSQGLRNAIQPVLAVGRVNFVGEPVAAVVSDDRYRSEDLLDSVEVEYDPLKPVVTVEEALHSEPIHDGMQSNILSDTWRGERFDDPSADIVLEDTLKNERIVPNPIEPRGVVAYYDGRMLNVWVSTQSIPSVRRGIIESLKISPDTVRVMQADTGGGFGSKGGLYPEYAIASFLSMKYRRPVKWIETRREHLMATNQGRGATGVIKIFAERTGKVLGIKGQITVDAGAYGSGMGSFAPGYIASMATGPYSIARAHLRAISVLTNKVPLGPYRGAGRPEAAFFIERMMDLLADELKMDPVELRLMNMSDKAFTSPLGMQIDAAKPFFQRVVKDIGYRDRVGAGGNVGISFFVLVPAVYPGESARIVVKDGEVHVWLGGNSHGQRHEVFVKKLASTELGVPEDRVWLFKGDSLMTPEGVGSWGSRSAIVGGAAVIAACRKLRKEIEKKHGHYSPDLLLSGEYDVFVFERQEKPVNSFGAVLTDAAVDGSGNVRVKECVGIFDVGRALNPEMVIGQAQGGMAQGIGQVLHEGVFYNDDGQLITSS
ncbi:MAG: xanthine dehydrogenase family protein molybdopterin-binding subunit, partial [Thermoplasma acidophilum]|nr:xanthine dehydrogenase family protein molybdopterin-binding subunit [Thermoplasma acidophilum]